MQKKLNITCLLSTLLVDNKVRDQSNPIGHHLQSKRQRKIRLTDEPHRHSRQS